MKVRRVLICMAAFAGALITMRLALSPVRYFEALYYTVALSVTIMAYLATRPSLFLFDPMVLFSFYYFSVVFSMAYSFLSEFRLNPFIKATSFSADLESVAAKTVLFFLVGYVSAVFGYESLSRKSNWKLSEYRHGARLTARLNRIIIGSCLTIGLGNFAINIIWFADGNLVLYMKNIAVRYLEFARGGTTLGYLFAYTGMFIWCSNLAAENRRPTFSFFLLGGLTVLMKVSLGRIFETVLYIALFIGMLYIAKARYGQRSKNICYFGAAFGIISCAVVFYFLRVLSSMAYAGSMQDGFRQSLSLLFQSVGYYMIDKGNMPNIAIAMKVIDSWEHSIGFMHGRSLIEWVYNILPSIWQPSGYQPSVIIKAKWFSNVPGGALPPTGIAEMYANFGNFGPILGMFGFGALCAIIKNALIGLRQAWADLVLMQIAIGFVMMYPKNEFDNLSLITIIPLLIFIAFMSMAKRKLPRDATLVDV